jgi:hypothetical protein
MRAGHYRGLRRRLGRGRTAKLGDRSKDYPPMSKEEPDVLEVLVGWILERGDG